jgi:hypothetical protein
MILENDNHYPKEEEESMIGTPVNENCSSYFNELDS